MQDPDDDLLPDVAALGQADRAILDPGFERNRVFGHVDAEARAAGLDAADVTASAADARRRHACTKRPFERDSLSSRGHDDVEASSHRRRRSRSTITGAASNVELARCHRAACDSSRVGDGRLMSAIAAARHRRATSRGPRSVDANLRRGLRPVLDLDVLAEDEHASSCRGRPPRPTPSRSTSSASPSLEHAHVGNHPALRGQVGRVAPGAGRERVDVVREETLQIGAPVRPREQQPAAGPDRSMMPGAVAKRVVLVG